ncbi:MAG: hypothetical protein ACKVOY_09225 [Burkholderiaceae bacterium]
MTSLKIWLKSTNGWQRIWFIGTIAGLLYYCVLFPLQEAGKGNSYRYDTKWKVEAEMKKPECAPYMSQPFNLLTEPSFPKTDEGCYYIYSHRQYADGNKSITKKSYEADFESEYREALFTYFGIGLVIATVLSLLIYGCGVLVAWVLKGFKSKEQD